MFNLNKISMDPITNQYLCHCNTDSSQTANEIKALYLMSVRENYGFTSEIRTEGTIVSIASPSFDATRCIAQQINTDYFMPPLDVYIFYGYSQKGLASRWCVGFNHPDANHVIEALNIQGSLVIADKDSQNWKTKDGNFYSVVLLSKVLEIKQYSKFEQRVNLYLRAIQNVTARKLNIQVLR